MPLWLAHRTWAFLWDTLGDSPWWPGTFLFRDHSSPRTRLSSTVYPSNLDFLCSSSNISSFSTWAMGLIWSWSGLPIPLASQYLLKILLSGTSGGEEDFDDLRPMSWSIGSRPPISARASSPAQGTLLAFQCTRCASLIFLWDDADRFRIQGAHSMAPL